MKMNLTKKMIRSAVLIAVVLAVFNVLAFVIPFEHSSLFWLGYGFGFFAHLFAIGVFVLAFAGKKDAKSRIYGCPLTRVALFYLGIQFVLSFIVMAISASVDISWPFTIVFILLLAAAIIGVVSVDIVRDVAEHQDETVRKNVQSMNQLRAMSSSLAARCRDPYARAELNKLSEAFRFSDPISCQATEAAEAELQSILANIDSALAYNDPNGVITLCSRATDVLAERNELAKLNKR